MNTYFEKNSDFNSNSRIFKNKFTQSAKPHGQARRSLDSFLFIIMSFLSEFPFASVLRILRVVGVAGSLIGFVGIIGAMERGSLGIGAGLLIGAILLGIEYLCLRTHKPSSSR